MRILYLKICYLFIKLWYLNKIKIITFGDFDTSFRNCTSGFIAILFIFLYGVDSAYICLNLLAMAYFSRN